MTDSVLVTGGSNGIGRAIVARLTGDGYRVINVDRVAPEPGSPGIFRQLDLTERAAAKTALAEICAEHGIARVVNNAGVVLAKRIEEVTPEEFDAGMALNVDGALLAVQGALPVMRAQRFGRIVTISSRAVVGRTRRTVYGMTKGALLSMTRTWALELAADNITANAIGPGPIDTPTFRRNNSQATADAMVRAIPMGRLGSPEDVAQAAAFFLDARSGFITGQMLFVCGGQSMGVQHA